MRIGNAWVSQWRQSIVDFATGAAAVLVAAASVASADLLVTLSIAGALVCVAWMLERAADRQSATGG